jgi:hypothetical protein
LPDLDVGRKRVADRRLNAIEAAVGLLNHRVAGIVDDVDVAAGAACHPVAAAAVEAIVSGVAGE